VASEYQHAFAGAYSNDEPALGEDDCDLAGFGTQWRANANHACEQRSQGDVYAKLFHDFFPPLKTRCDRELFGKEHGEIPEHCEQNAGSGIPTGNPI
jgi:hypothetical protein